MLAKKYRNWLMGQSIATCWGNGWLNTSFPCYSWIKDRRQETEYWRTI